MNYKNRLQKIEQAVKPKEKPPLVLWDRKATEEEKQKYDVIQVTWI